MITGTNDSSLDKNDYLTKVNFWMLLLCLLHVPFIAGIAYYFNSGVWTAILVGVTIAGGPAIAYHLKKDSAFTSILIGIALMSFSALLIHHARGMIEMHFHIFAFIAMMIIFANPWVIIAAAATIAVHHISFYFLLPNSVFNYQASFGIVIVHALFVILETVPAVIISQSFYKIIISDQSSRRLNMINTNMVNTCPLNIMMATKEGVFTYINESSKITLKKLQKYLPEKSDILIGKNLNLFYADPMLPKGIIDDPNKLPHRSVINIGPEKLEILIGAIFDDRGSYLGPMITWEIVTNKIELVRNLNKASDNLSSAASNVLTISTNLSAAAERTSAQANTASVASEEVNSGVQSVASNMEEMVAAIKEITKTTNEASLMTNEAMRITKDTNVIINKLGDSSMDIGNVIKVISSIAQQTNLLALNATIEAARAGEAGKGFAVVANEVKELANQTAKATGEITKKIETIQDDSKNAIEAIAKISSAIEKVNGFTGNIAAAIEQPAATTNDVTRIITESAQGVKQISENISQVSQAATNTGKDAGSAQDAAKGVGEIATSLKQYVDQLKT